MTFTIPDAGEPENDIQSIFFQEQLEVLVAGLVGTDCVLSGGAVTAQGSPDMTVAVAKAAVLTNGLLRAVTAGNVTVPAADVTNPRIDLIVVTSAGAKANRQGTAAAAPKPPARTANDVVLAAVYVPAAATTITTARITDWRVVRTQGPILIKKSTTPVATNTTAAAITVATVTLPSGLFLSGKIMRLRAYGNYLANSGTPTFTLTLAYGGSTFFLDVTVATTTDADRGAWHLDLDLIATGDATQSLAGHVSFQSPGAKNAPTTGVAGDMATVADVNAAFSANAGAVDSDAADRTFTVQWTMSVSNVADEIRVEGYTVELL